MKVLLSIIISTIGALGNLTFVLIIVIYIFAVIGMQLFSKDYTRDKFFPDPVPRWNFNDFFHSFMMIFRILCGEWIEPLWDCMRAEKESGPEMCFAIFLPALVMGNFMVLNLFLALLLNSFNSEELKQKKEEVGDDSNIARSFERIRSIFRKNRRRRQRQSDKIVREVTDKSDNGNKYAIQETVLNIPKDSTVTAKPYDEGAKHQPQQYTVTPVYRTATAVKQQQPYNEEYESSSLLTKPPPSDRPTEENIEMQIVERPMSDKLDDELPPKSPRETQQLSPHKDKVMEKRPWHALVSYVDELTIGGRRDSKGRYIDGLGTFPGFGRNKQRKVPQDCFPRQCYER